jgi:hypothetical protein
VGQAGAGEHDRPGVDEDAVFVGGVDGERGAGLRIEDDLGAE